MEHPKPARTLRALATLGSRTAAGTFVAGVASGIANGIATGVAALPGRSAFKLPSAQQLNHNLRTLAARATGATASATAAAATATVSATRTAASHVQAAAQRVQEVTQRVHEAARSAGNAAARAHDLAQSAALRLRVAALAAVPQLPGFNDLAGAAPATPAGTFETLESRRLLASVTLVNGVLHLVGDATSDNEMAVQASGSSYLYAYVDSATKKVSRSSVRSVKFVGGGRKDTIFLASDLSIPTDVKAGAGDDDIRVGRGNDVIDAGDGNDRIWSRPGDDRVLGGAGNDNWSGDYGDDYFDGGPGNDIGDGEEGEDEVIGGAGDDTLHGGGEDDRVSGGDGDDTLYGHSGNDLLLGGNDDDTLDGGSGADTLDGGGGTNVKLNLKPEDKVPAGSNWATPGGGTGGTGYTGVGVTGNEETVYGRAVNSSTPRPVINLIGKSGVAPHPVHVHALSSTLNGGSAITARYQWEFGDASGRFNKLEGWNASHMYDEAGTYTIRLTITNENGQSNSVTTTVRVVEDQRRTIYVDSSAGRDSNSGLSSSAPIKSVARLEGLLDSNTRVLFKRGLRYSFDRSVSVNFHNVLIGAYGSGGNPLIWRVAGRGTSCFSMYDKSNQVVVQDLTFDSPYAVSGSKAPDIPASGIMPRGVNIAVRRCEFRNLQNAVDSSGDPRGLLVLDNRAPLKTGLRAYFVWSEGSDHVYLGNSAANSTREHIVRSSGTARMLVAYNNFTNLDRSDVDASDYDKGVVEVHKGSYAYVANNDLYDGALRAGPRGNGWEPPETATNWVVFENNRVHEHDIIVYPGTHHFMARNNVVRTDSSAAFVIIPTDNYGRKVTDVWILNNTAYTSRDEGKFFHLVTAGSRNGAITVKNNMWVAPRFIAGNGQNAPIYVHGPDLSAFREISNNVWPEPASYERWGQGGINYVHREWEAQAGYMTQTEWDRFANVWDEEYDNSSVDSQLRPRSGTVAARAGERVKGVFTDMYGRERPDDGPWTAGALQV